MKTELQNKVWSILPKEFKEEVKKEYYHDDSNPFELAQLEAIFGIHNLISDEEGEDEILCVSRKQIDALQGEIFKAIVDAHDSDDWQDAAHYILDVMPRSFAALFGSECLPDEACNVSSNVASNVASNIASSEPKPKPAEPKFKVGDKVIYEDFIGTVHQIEETDYVIRNSVGGDLIGWINESDLEPYTAPTEKRAENAQERATCTDDCSGKRSCQSRNLSQNIADCHTHICNRLTIAAMAMQGILANSHQEMVDMEIDKVAELAIEAADAIIAECEKGGKNA